MSETIGRISPKNLEFIINHVFLPPKLPDKADENVEEKDSALLGVVLSTAKAYQKQLPGPYPRWNSCVRMLSTMSDLQNGKSLAKVKLSIAIRNMRAGDVLALYINGQNAGIIMRQLKDQFMMFESFEASPTAAAVIACEGRLQCSYPGPVIAVRLPEIKDLTFIAEFSSFLEQMNREELEEAMPIVSKGGSKHVETRDTAHPKFITEMLTGILRGIGQPVSIERLRKRIADDVVWKDTNLPWRRSPLWLVMRVALQSTLDRSAEGQYYSQYKAFMIFLMAQILDIALEQQLPSDILFVMNAKLGRRAYKMKERMPKFLLSKVLDQVSRTARILETRWTRQSHQAYINWKPQTLSFSPDTHISLVNGGSYLAAVINRKVTTIMSNGSNANHKTREAIELHRIPKRKIISVSGAERYIALADFELWVRQCLDGWLTTNLQREEACQELSECITDYTTAGKEAYECNPESISILLLTTMELWIALDKVAVGKYPLLAEYFPEFPENIFHRLLLPRHHQMKRLRRIETYLHERRIKANASNPSIFSSVVGAKTFAVRYFENSLVHQKLEQSIQREAEIERKGKIAEFEKKTQQYDAIVAEARDAECEVRYNRRGDRLHDSRRCQKCSLMRRARGVKIEVHEWPLPEGKQCMAVVFELQCPRGFSVWRDATYRVLVDVLSTTQSENPSQLPFEDLRSYLGLQKHYIGPGQRLSWSSKTKSTRRSHYGGRSFPISVGGVCVKNALQYKLFDTGGVGWAPEKIECNVGDVCTFKLPDGPYQVLQYAVNRTSHTSNQVISNQSECPIELSIHEYLAFGMLREGHRLQWLNIARELRTRSLNFSHEAVNMLLTQAAWQAGPSDTLRDARDCHTILESLEFGATLLRELGDMLTSIGANWLEGVSAKTLIYLTTRLLSVTGHANVRGDAFLLLRRARTITLEWTRQLVVQLQKCEKEKDMKDLQLRALQMAAICRATYDVDHDDLWDVLNSDEDVAVLVECAIIIHDNTPTAFDKLSLSTRSLLDRDRRLSHILEVQLRQLISIRREGLNRSISRVWQGYESEYPWKCLSAPNERWVETRTTGVISQLVRYNLLNGQLLINGLPLARLPNEYVSHPTYTRLFREKVLDVYPSDMPGMTFQIRHEICGHQVNFGMQGTELIIRTRDGQNEYELVPHTKLVGDFSTHFVEQYFHWLNVSTRELEFRPADDPWKATTKNWHLHYLGMASYMTLDRERMFDIRKTTAVMISSVLSQLEYPQYIDVTFLPATRRVSAHLPRLKLDFFINGQNELECQQFRGMIVDSDQSIGTLNGLVNRLVMRQKTVRSVIIPHGNLEYRENENHVSVRINTEDMDRVTYHLYTVDTNLGRLVGNDSLGSHLYKIYLHAVTAHCLPDPLTNRTGTEEALAGLRSAATWSFQKLEKEEIELLTLIASLTPTRVYYPQHLEVMQTVSWGCLSPVVQHDEFHTIVTSIFNHAARFHIFREDGRVLEYYKSKSSAHLLARAATRNAAFRRDEFGGSLLIITKDAPYTARHIGWNSVEGARAWDVARAVERWNTNLPVCPQLIGVLEGWGRISGDSDGMMLSLGYNRVMLDGNIASFWGLLYNGLCQATKQQNRYQLIFMLSTMAYSGQVDLLLIGTFLAFATNTKFRSYYQPIHSSYDLSDEYEPDEDELIEIMEDTAFLFEDSAEASLDITYGESDAALQDRREEAFKYNLRSQAEYFVSYLMSQWPCFEPDPLSKAQIDQNFPLLNVEAAMKRVNPWFESCYKNKEFRDHIEEVQAELDRISPDTNKVLPIYIPESYENEPLPSFSAVLLEQLFLREPPTIPKPPIGSTQLVPLHEQFAAPKGESHLKSLLSEFGAAHSDGYEKEYAASMLKSFEALKGQTLPAFLIPSPDALVETQEEFKCYLLILYQLIQKKLGPSKGVETLISMVGLWPCISPISLLQQLATNNRATNFNPQWRRILIAYGEAITMVQRAERLLSYASRDDDDFIREAENPGSQGRDQLSYADWLLISIENNFLVRPVQAQIAAKMISPHSNNNETLQLNMGEGKSSVIVPIVSAALADGKKLVRVVVLKPLSGQMFRLLVQKLSGLTNRRIFFMPFSRSVKLDIEKAKLVRELYEECMRIGGILLIQPEHILSFKLMGLDQLFDDKNQEVAAILLDCQRWLERNSRDILDESDEILHVRHELIYTLGQSKSVDFSPTRWTIVQQIFSIIQRHVVSIQKRFPQGLEVEELSGISSSGGFSITRILQRKAGEALFSQVTSDIFAGHLEMVSFRLFPEYIRQLAYKFITIKGMSEVESRPLLSYCDENDISRSALLLLRGLIAGKILFFALEEKRWRVDYGLNLHRSMLAVPYRAKDCPSLRAEFSHPDVAIALTCLSYYYTGLNDPQLKHCFAILMKSDNPIVEYEAWANEDSTLPESLRQLSGINLVDNHQRKDIIFPRFRHNKSTIDFYLSRVVFPKQAREFPYKLSTSGFDIAESKTHPTTGFSGTNDNKPLLPLSITQHESQEQLNTNAKVLSYLLQPENSYLCAAGMHGERLDVDKLLYALVEQYPPIQVLLDVGAQVLEKRNEEVARDWLKLVPLAQAAVFFSEDDELTVISRDAGSRQPLMVSAFAKRMDECLVYLDEVHTRGTDLKLPTNRRAAVTLGPNLTKDRLVQACMRMRKLGHGQSVIFCAPPEIHQKILKCASKPPTAPVEVSDVLKWSMQETCANTRKLVPIWAKQGIGYQRRHVAWQNSRDTGQLKLAMLEPEAQTLEERFGLRLPDKQSFFTPGPASEPRHIELCWIRENCRKFKITSLREAQAQEEQERELAHEVEREQHIERPPKATAHEHHIHQDVIEFVRTGKIKKPSPAFLPAFETLSKTSVEKYRQNNSWTNDLLATKDFASTVCTRQGDSMDDFLRPVRWVVSGKGKSLVIMSPHEVNELIPMILRYGSVCVHAYSPKVTKVMKTFEELTFCPIAPVIGALVEVPIPLVEQLSIFAGQLYLRDYDAYERLCGFLGLYLKEIPPGQTISINSDGFVRNSSVRTTLGMGYSPFSKSPVLFLRRLMDCRRKGQTYLATHIGQILHGRLLSEKDFNYEDGEGNITGGEDDYDEEEGEDIRDGNPAKMMTNLSI